MIGEAISFIAEKISEDTRCAANVADIARLSNLPPSGELVLSLVNAKQFRPVDHRRAPLGMEITILLSSWFDQYVAGLSTLHGAMQWVIEHPVLNAPVGLVGPQSTQISLALAELPSLERSALWQSLRIPLLPSAVLTAKVLAER